MKEKNIMVMLGTIIAAIVILGFFIIISLNQTVFAFKQELQNVNAKLSDEFTALNSQSDSLISSIQNKLDKQASLITDYSVTYGTPDAATRKCDVTVSAVPKTSSAGTTATLFIGDQTAVMTQTGSAYEATIPFSIVESGKIYVTFSQDGINQTEMLPEIADPRKLVSYRFNAQYEGDNYFEGDQFVMTGRVNVVFTPIHSDTIKSAAIIACQDGKEIWRRDIVHPEKLWVENKPHEIPLASAAIPITGKNDINVYFEFICGSGFTYRCGFYGYDQEAYSGVFDENGRKIDIKQTN